MNELQLKTISLVPATIDFNKQAIMDELNETLKKYDNLVFTEENTADIRKVLAELRKGKTAADNFRKENKKKAIAPVTAFESEVKEIVALFDNVIDPINKQLTEFDTKQREAKQIELEAHKKKVIETFGLEDKYAERIEIRPEFLNKSASLKQSKETIEFVANNLLNEQKLEQMNRDNLETHIKLIMSENDVTLPIGSYLSQLEFKDVESIKRDVGNDVIQIVEKEKARREAERLKLEEGARREAERLRLEEEAKQQSEQTEKEQVAFEEVNQPTEVELDEPFTKPIIDDVPFIFGDVETERDNHTISFVITAEETELNKVRSFLSGNEIDWREE